MKAYFAMIVLHRHKILWIAVRRRTLSTATRRRAYRGAMDTQTRLKTWLTGARVGTDVFGNVYYRSRRPVPGARERRWVTYANGADASAVPPEWYAWLHHTADAPIPDANRRPWEKPFLPNETGTPLSYRPPGHDYEGGKRAVATGDYEAWTPTD